MNPSNRSVAQRTGAIFTTKYENRRSAWLLLAIALLMMLPSRAAFAQYDTGGLVGAIRDSSGSAVPNVTVTVTNDATGVATVVHRCALAFTPSQQVPRVMPSPRQSQLPSPSARASASTSR